MLINHSDHKHLNWYYTFRGGVASDPDPIVQLIRQVTLCEKVVIPPNLYDYVDASGFNILQIALYHGNYFVVEQLLNKERLLHESFGGSNTLDILILSNKTIKYIFEIYDKIDVSYQEFAIKYNSTLMKHSKAKEIIKKLHSKEKIHWVMNDFPNNKPLVTMEYLHLQQNPSFYNSQSFKEYLTSILPNIRVTGKLTKEILKEIINNDNLDMRLLFIFDIFCSSFKDINLVRHIIELYKEIKLPFREVFPNNMKMFIKQLPEHKILRYLKTEENEFLFEDSYEIFNSVHISDEEMKELLKKSKRLRDFHNNLFILRNEKIREADTSQALRINYNFPESSKIDDKKEKGFHFYIPKSSNDLIAIGNRMRNCVGGYTKKISTGNCWVLLVKDISSQKEYLLEISRDRKITQAVSSMDRTMNNEILSKVINILKDNKILEESSFWNMILRHLT